MFDSRFGFLSVYTLVHWQNALPNLWHRTITRAYFSLLILIYVYIETQPNSSGSEFNWTGWFFDFYTLRLVFRQNDDDWYDGLWTVQIIRDWMVSVCVCVHALVCSNKIVVGQIMPLLSASVNITSQYTVASFMLYSSACCAYVRRRCRFFLFGSCWLLSSLDDRILCTLYSAHKTK